MPDRAIPFILYKPRQNGEGGAIQLQLSYKKDNEREPWMVFLEAAKQSGKNDKGNDTFDWDNKIVVKLGENDLGEMISVLEGRKDAVGGERGTLFHNTPGGGNKVIGFQAAIDNDGNRTGYYLNISAQSADKKTSSKVGIVIHHHEASLFLVLLKRAVERSYCW